MTTSTQVKEKGKKCGKEWKNSSSLLIEDLKDSSLQKWASMNQKYYRE